MKAREALELYRAGQMDLARCMLYVMQDVVDIVERVEEKEREAAEKNEEALRLAEKRFQDSLNTWWALYDFYKNFHLTSVEPAPVLPWWKRYWYTFLTWLFR